MCRKAILPTAVNAASLDSEIMNLIYTFNRWLNMLEKYSKLDRSRMTEDFSLISRILKKGPIDKSTKSAVSYCRDYALAASMKIDKLTRALKNALHRLCDAHEESSLKKVRKSYDDQGMTEKYRPLSKRLAKEKIRKIGKSICYTDDFTDDGNTSRLAAGLLRKELLRQCSSYQEDAERTQTAIVSQSDEPSRSACSKNAIPTMTLNSVYAALTGK